VLALIDKDDASEDQLLVAVGDNHGHQHRPVNLRNKCGYLSVLRAEPYGQ